MARPLRIEYEGDETARRKYRVNWGHRTCLWTAKRVDNLTGD